MADSTVPPEGADPPQLLDKTKPRKKPPQVTWPNDPTTEQLPSATAPHSSTKRQNMSPTMADNNPHQDSSDSSGQPPSQRRKSTQQTDPNLTNLVTVESADSPNNQNNNNLDPDSNGSPTSSSGTTSNQQTESDNNDNSATIIAEIAVKNSNDGGGKQLSTVSTKVEKSEHRSILQDHSTPTPSTEPHEDLRDPSTELQNNAANPNMGASSPSTATVNPTNNTYSTIHSGEFTYNDNYTTHLSSTTNSKLSFESDSTGSLEKAKKTPIKTGVVNLFGSYKSYTGMPRSKHHKADESRTDLVLKARRNSIEHRCKNGHIMFFPSVKQSDVTKLMKIDDYSVPREIRSHHVLNTSNPVNKAYKDLLAEFDNKISTANVTVPQLQAGRKAVERISEISIKKMDMNPEPNITMNQTSNYKVTRKYDYLFGIGELSWDEAESRTHMLTILEALGLKPFGSKVHKFIEILHSVYDAFHPTRILSLSYEDYQDIILEDTSLAPYASRLAVYAYFQAMCVAYIGNIVHPRFFHRGVVTPLLSKLPDSSKFLENPRTFLKNTSMVPFMADFVTYYGFKPDGYLFHDSRRPRMTARTSLELRTRQQGDDSNDHQDEEDEDDHDDLLDLTQDNTDFRAIPPNAIPKASDTDEPAPFRNPVAPANEPAPFRNPVAPATGYQYTIPYVKKLHAEIFSTKRTDAQVKNPKTQSSTVTQEQLGITATDIPDTQSQAASSQPKIINVEDDNSPHSSLGVNTSNSPKDPKSHNDPARSAMPSFSP